MLSTENTLADAEYSIEPAKVVTVFEERYDNSTETNDIARLAKVNMLCW